MLISSLLGVSSRVTKDLDTTVRGFTLTHESASLAFREICAVSADDDLRFEFVRTEDIRETDDYPGIRVFVKARYPPMVVSLSIDVTTGDAITPGAIEYRYPLMFDEGCISLMAYPLETCLAEKIETVVSRGVTNTRPRDYYDIVMLWQTRKDVINVGTLSSALIATADKRGSAGKMGGYLETMDRVVSDKTMNARWKSYAKDYGYVGDVSFECACSTVCEIMSECWSPSRS